MARDMQKTTPEASLGEEERAGGGRSAASGRHLLASRRFGPFFATQFLGALNDNLFKNALVVLLTFHTAQWTDLSPGLLANLAAGLFILPFFLFSASAGQFADKFDKAALARRVKLLEIAIMALAAVGFAQHRLPWLLAALFLLGLHSTLFGPVKYAILPQHLRPDELIAGNAWVEAGTFVAILLGTLGGALLAALPAATQWIPAGCLLLAVLGYLTSRAIPPAPPPAPGLRLNPNFLAETRVNLGFARREPTVFVALLAISWFWLYGAVLLAQFPAYGRDVLGGDESAVTLLLLVFTIGIGAGSFLCQRLSGAHLNVGLVPLGAAVMVLAGLDFAWASTAAGAGELRGWRILLADAAVWRVLFDLLALGTAGGVFIVPFYALMQLRSPVEHRARIVAANNILNAAFMVAGALGAASALGHGVSMAALFGALALAHLGVMLMIHRRCPEYWQSSRVTLARWLHGKIRGL